MGVTVRIERIRQSRSAAVECYVKGKHGWLVLVWLPRSQVEGGYMIQGGEGPMTVTVPRWLAEQKGIAIPEPIWA